MGESETKPDPPRPSFEAWIVGVAATLMAAGIAAMWTMNASLSRVEERLLILNRQFELRIEQMATENRAQDQRIYNLERDLRGYLQRRQPDDARQQAQ